MVNNVRQDTTNPNTAPIDARPYQLNLLKLERRGMRPMALKVLNRSHSTKTKLAAVAGVAAMLVSLNATSEAYAAKLNLKPAIAEQSVLVLRDAVACCDQLADFVTVGATEEALRAQITNLFGLIDAEHKRLEGFADALGARLVRATTDTEPPPDTDIGSGGKESLVWLNHAKINAEAAPEPEPEDDIGSGGKTNLAWLSRVNIGVPSSLLR